MTRTPRTPTQATTRNDLDDIQIPAPAGGQDPRQEGKGSAAERLESAADRSEEGGGTGRKVLTVHRIGALLVGSTILVFGILGFAGGLGFFSTEGTEVLGLSSNGLLSTISVVTAVLLFGAAFSGAQRASSLMTAIGVLFLVSALVNLGLMRTEHNVLAFELPNVVFSIVAGLVLLLTGTYGRVSGNLPKDNPYYVEKHKDDPDADVVHDERPSTPAEEAAERAMRAAEIAVVQKRATPDQEKRVEAMTRVRSRQARRAVWMSLETRNETGTPEPDGLAEGWGKQGILARAASWVERLGQKLRG